MDLISRKAAIDRLNAIPPGNWSKVRYTRELWNVPSVKTVPLDKLCEFLGGAVTPCILLNIGCPYNEATSKDCDSCRAREAWEITLSKWMEEQDVAD